jgi:hypothetical protein
MHRLLIIALFLLAQVVLAQSTDGLEKSNRKAAILRSIAVPGWGQHYLNKPGSARKHYISEAGLAIAMLVGRSLADSRQKDYRTYAAANADADFAEKPDIYYVRIGAYDNIREYNEVMLRNHQLNAVYELGTGSDWDWNDDATRLEFKEIRKASNRWAKMSAYMIGGMMLNRLVSAVHVLFLTSAPFETTSTLQPMLGGGQWTLAVTF